MIVPDFGRCCCRRSWVCSCSLHLHHISYTCTIFPISTPCSLHLHQTSNRILRHTLLKVLLEEKLGLQHELVLTRVSQRLVIYCQTTGVSAAHATHCATYYTPCRPLIRASSGSRAPPLSKKLGTYKTVRTRFWPWLWPDSGPCFQTEGFENVSSCPGFQTEDLQNDLSFPGFQSESLENVSSRSILARNLARKQGGRTGRPADLPPNGTNALEACGVDTTGKFAGSCTFLKS